METTEELTAFLRDITQDGYRGRLQARGQARALIRHEGNLPPDAPAFSEEIDSDLADYGLSVLRASLALRELGGDAETWRKGFLQAAGAFEALVQNGSPADASRGFYRTAGAASYHLANYSALAFSLLTQAQADQNRSPVEDALTLLIVRDLQGLGQRARAWLSSPANRDEGIAREAAEGALDPDGIVSRVATSTMFRALVFFEFALQTGQESLVVEARNLLRRSISLTKAASAVSLWWILRITANLIDDLWSSSLHKVLPSEGPPGSRDYAQLRKLFVAELYSRKSSEVELWPSQLQAAQRAVDVSDDLVVALPTSAGKTRIAEIAALMALACGRRVLIVTPLRALSAQTERSFRKTFTPLGFSVSSLYGSSGIAGTDEDALREQNIVIATPEKLDFALRNDTDIINDVGLIVLDEGHLIGPSEREIRYENLVQRLLRRTDHGERRIVCLSAILPAGDQLNDLTAWIRSDTPGDPIQSSWRPTRQRFGTLSWIGNSARLGFDLEPDGPFIRHFVPEAPPIRPRRKAFPKDNKELTLAAAWRFSEQGKRALVFCTQRDHVEGFAKTALDLQRRGFLPSLLAIASEVERAMAVGREWLGADHPAVRCLAIGVAIHHGRLPGPFLREVEGLLAAGVLRVTVASPTLAQGLNLNAAVLLIPSLYRAGTLITGEEFANVAGRAGRAFVDLEGLVIHVMHQPDNWRHQQWRQLVTSAKARSLSSGIIVVVNEVVRRLATSGVFSREDAMEYLSSTRDAWFPEAVDGELESDSVESLIERLDATVLGLIEALDAQSADLPRLIDEALSGSLWARQIARLDAVEKQNQLWILLSRARLIWNTTTVEQRKGQFAMGVGLESGLAIDALAAELTQLLDRGDEAALASDADALIAALVGMGERLLAIRPFVPDDPLPANWRDLLATWVHGQDVAAIGQEAMRIVDDAFVYRLVWAIEALRMNRRINGGESELPVEGAAAACLEAGLPSNAMAMLVRAGLPSRVAAKTVVEQLAPGFTNRAEMKAWLRSAEVAAFDHAPEWPTIETHAIWQQFRRDALSSVDGKWTSQEWTMQWSTDSAVPLRVEVDPQSGQVSITTPDFSQLTTINQRLRTEAPSLFEVAALRNGTNVSIRRIGRGEAHWVEQGE
ncbi:DEAD/DEAH box helicase [Stenotrophomonas maltophilia]|uniref:DEAD/DEAH box helicase n=1 Tax=Stenotrophomonas maltophilia TaxID=40324 RepID=UPI0021C7F83A|nr:DEAD/DEAH box helicase [Stenotrophomonas maltophilia]MCU0999281.1 DEAD/DEAH box helicase [Stenotrophomonas maltophilia]